MNWSRDGSDPLLVVLGGGKEQVRMVFVVKVVKAARKEKKN